MDSQLSLFGPGTGTTLSDSIGASPSEFIGPGPEHQAPARTGAQRREYPPATSLLSLSGRPGTEAHSQATRGAGHGGRVLRHSAGRGG